VNRRDAENAEEEGEKKINRRGTEDTEKSRRVLLGVAGGKPL